MSCGAHLVEGHWDDAQRDVRQDDGDAEHERQRNYFAELCPAQPTIVGCQGSSTCIHMHANSVSESVSSTPSTQLT